MMEGRVRAALQLLTNESRSGLLSLEEVVSDGSGRTVRDVLEEKHPDPEPAHADTILNEQMTIVLTSIRFFSTTSLAKLFEIQRFTLQALQDLQG